MDAHSRLAEAEAPVRDEARHFLRRLNDLDPYWAAQLVVAGALALELLLPEKLTAGPTWLLPALEALLLLGLIAFSPHPKLRYSPARRRVAVGLTGVVSASNAVSLGLLCHYLLHGGTGNGRQLMFSGLLLWVTNVLLFGLWYWQLDRGGPLERALAAAHPPDFMFPQMTDPRWAPRDWRPGLIDYMYVSFTNATAFSPTDTMPLSPAAKLLMSAQSVVALLTLALVVARAVSILG
jgi:hypothetical protein